MANEQPMNSLQYWLPGPKETLGTIGAHRYVLCAGAYGGDSVKDLELYATLPHWCMLKFLSAGRKQAKARFRKAHVQPAKLAQLSKNHKWICGNSVKLAKSKVYPRELAQAIFRAAEAAFLRNDM